MNWQLSGLTSSFKSSLSLTRSHTLTRHTKQQILTLPDSVPFLGVGLAEQTAGVPLHRLSSWQAPVCSAHTPRVLLSPCGGPSTLQSAPCGSSSGVTSSHSPAEQDRTCQCQANTCWRLGVSDFWFWLSEWVSEWVGDIKIHITVSNQVEAGSASTCVVCCVYQPLQRVIWHHYRLLYPPLCCLCWLFPKGNAIMHSFSVTLLPRSFARAKPNNEVLPAEIQLLTKLFSWSEKGKRVLAVMWIRIYRLWHRTFFLNIWMK